MEYFNAKAPTEQVRSKAEESSNIPSPFQGAPEPREDIEEIEDSKKGWFAYFKTRNFYIVLVLGYAIQNST